MKRVLFYLSFVLIFSHQNIQAQTPLTQAVDFTVTDIEGNSIQLFDLLDNQGKYVLIDFFFTSCVPCQAAVPHISEAYRYFGCGEYDVEFIAMDYNNTNEQCEEFDAQYGVAYPTVSGIEGGGNQVCIDYGIPLYPTVILIAPDHSILEQYIWPISSANAVITPLESYGIQGNSCSLIADLSPNTTEICDHEYVQFSNHSQGEVITFEWIFDGGYPPVSNEENPVVIYPNAGSFDVSLTISNENDESVIAFENLITVHNCTGLNTLETEAVSILPNPSNGVFNINIPVTDRFKISVMNYNGALVYHSSNSNTVDISTLGKGVYFVKIEYDGIIDYKKVIVH